MLKTHFVLGARPLTDNIPTRDAGLNFNEA
jgi:hypothetical protein